MKVIIVGGLAGSGKTTSILRMAKVFSDSGQKIGVIVQETGDVDYDDKTLNEMGIKKKYIDSVCIPCSLDADIINNITALNEEFKPDVIFIEAEETVLPIRIKSDLERMNLEGMQIAPMIIVVDAVEFPLETDMLLRFTRMQVEDADIICLNKKDLADQARISQLNKMFKELNFAANVLELDAKSGENISDLIYSLG